MFNELTNLSGYKLSDIRESLHFVLCITQYIKLLEH